MAYMDEMAAERERSKQALLAGKQPLLGDDTTRALHTLGVNLGVVPPGTPPSAMSQLLQGLVGKLGKINIDASTPLQVAPEKGGRTPSTDVNRYSDGGADLGGTLKGILDAAKVSKGKTIPKTDEKPGSVRGASIRDAAVRGRHGSEPAAAAPPPIPGPYGQPMPAPGTTTTGPADHAGGTGGGVAGDVPGLPGGPSGRALTREERAATGAAATGDRMLPGADLSGVDPRIKEIVGAAAEGLPPGYKIKPTSGMRDTGQGQHTKGKAVDWQIIDPEGKPVSNRGNDTTGMYTELARNAYGYQEKNHPDMTGTFQWGGQFGTSAANPNEPDLMHFDNGGRRGRITQYSRETIGAKLPPGASGTPQAAAPAASATSATPATPASGPRAAGVPPELSKLVMSKEWFTPDAKNDYGQKSIGYGTSANGRTSITEPEARAEMNAQLQQHLNKIDQQFPNLSPDVRNSVASLTYNVGEKWMTEPGNKLAASLKAGDMPGAKQAFMQYVHVTDANGNKSVLQGLVNRRTDEARAFDGQKPQYTPNPDAPKGAQPAVAAAPAPAAPQKMAPDFSRAATAAQPADVSPNVTQPAQPAATVFDKGTDAVPVAGVGALQQPDVEAGTTATHTVDPATAALNAVKPPEAAVPPTAAAAVAPPPPQPAARVMTPPPAPPPAAVAATPPPPARPAAPPPAPPPAATGVSAAHQLLDTNMKVLAQKFAPDRIPLMTQMGIDKQTLRQALGNTMSGNAIREGITPHLEKQFGVKPADFDRAYREPSPGKRADAGTSDATDFSARSRTPMAPPGLDGKVPTPQARPDGAPTMDPGSQPAVQNANGDISTVRTMGFEDNGRQVNVPSVPAEGGRIMSNAEAYQRYKDTGKHLGKYDTVEQAGAAAERLHQQEAQQISQHPQGPQQPQVTPEMAKALENAFKDEARIPQGPPPPPEALPVPPVNNLPQGVPGGPQGGLSLAPGGLSSLPTNALMPATAGSQGGSIATMGLAPLPAIENSTYSTPLLDQMATSNSMFGSSSLSPISPTILGGWGWGGGSGFNMGGGGGFDFGGGGGMVMPEMSFGAGG